MELVLQQLQALRDETYQAFQSKLIPTMAPEKILGVRTPALRQFAKVFAKMPEAEAFLAELPHVYYEEDNLHAFLIETTKDYQTCIARLNAFLPYVDNWATCDCMSPKVLGKHRAELLEQLQIWLQSDHVYTVRYAIGLLMRYYLEDYYFDPVFLNWVAQACCEEYYINMMVAWYFATALAKQYDRIIPILQEQILPVWVHNKAIQKAIESYRISAEQKQYLRTLKRTSKNRVC